MNQALQTIIVTKNNVIGISQMARVLRNVVDRMSWHRGSLLHAWSLLLRQGRFTAGGRAATYTCRWQPVVTGAAWAMEPVSSAQAAKRSLKRLGMPGPGLRVGRF